MQGSEIARMQAAYSCPAQQTSATFGMAFSTTNQKRFGRNSNASFTHMQFASLRASRTIAPIKHRADAATIREYCRGSNDDRTRDAFVNVKHEKKLSKNVNRQPPKYVRKVPKRRYKTKIEPPFVVINAVIQNDFRNPRNATSCRRRRAAGAGGRRGRGGTGGRLSPIALSRDGRGAPRSAIADAGSRLISDTRSFCVRGFL
ncbi:hypothetical protein EVAR_56758_1 [Eumeta japonica]|uniref:Uncharacterized protein n=1 Tax=Eumeta variegata TaxID=151549 RepID=A0A4C1XLF6_EUMVA|nr:hypothetical protein EVAR_56758_1 [Eumeta japonica]